MTQEELLEPKKMKFKFDPPKSDIIERDVHKGIPEKSKKPTKKEMAKFKSKKKPNRKSDEVIALERSLEASNKKNSTLVRTNNKLKKEMKLLAGVEIDYVRESMYYRLGVMFGFDNYEFYTDQLKWQVLEQANAVLQAAAEEDVAELIS